jgi:hypothetical protein
VILDPINDTECLGQLTLMARELAPTTLVREVARRLGARDGVIRWFKGLPQADDDGRERVRYIVCDVPQRVRLLPDDPNCVERSVGALMLLEALDPATPRALATVDRPERHTGLVEKHGTTWRAVDLFPRRNGGTRNLNWGELGKDILQGVHRYVGKPILSFYGLGGVADTVGELQDKAIGRDKKNNQQKKPSPPAGKSNEPQRPQGAKGGGAPTNAKQGGSPLDGIVGSVLGGGAKQEPKRPVGAGVKSDGKAKGDGAGVGAVNRPADDGQGKAADRDGGDSHDAGASAQRGWWWWLR